MPVSTSCKIFSILSSVFFGVVLILVCLACPSGAPAQTELAGVYGRVTDPSGAVIVDAEVEIKNVDTNVSVTVKTNQDGLYTIPSLHPGHYLINVRKPGFKSVTVTELTLNVQDNMVRNFALQVGSIAETVTITADDLHMNTTDAAVSTVIDRRFVENLPLNGRSFQTLIELSPGVVITPSSQTDPGQFSVNGQRSSSNYFTVDGVSANIGIQAGPLFSQGAAGSVGGVSVTGGTNSLVSEDALQEFRIQTSTFAPEFGRTPGAQVSILTRSGTNQFHGALFEFLRNDKLDANDWFADQLTGSPKAAERINDFGAVVGGPIVRDRTFFFFSYEGQRLRLPQTTITTVPDVTARQSAPAVIQPFLNAYPLPNGAEILDNNGNPTSEQARFSAAFSNQSSLNATSLRIDHNLSSRLNLFGRYVYAPSDALQRGGGFVSLNTLGQVQLNTQTLTLGTTWSITPALNNEFRFNYSRNEAKIGSRLDTFGGAVVPPASILLPSPFTQANATYTFGIALLQGGSWVAGSQGSNLQRQFNVVDNIAIQKGSHNLKFGVDYRRLSPIFTPPNYNLAPFFLSVPTAVSNKPIDVGVSAARNGTLLFKNVGLFAQDTWRFNSRLAMTYGLRWDVDFSPSTINGPDLLAVTGFNNPTSLALAPAGTSLFQTTYDNFAPRVGLAYVFHQTSGWETVLRGGFGLFYDLASTQTGNAVNQFAYPFGAMKRVFSNNSFPLSASVTQPPTISVASLASSSTLVAFDPNLRLPRTFQWNATLEQSLGSKQLVSVAYVAAAGRRLLQEEETLFPNPNFFLVQFIGNQGTSDYHSFQAQFQRRLSGGVQILASYTLAHSIDTASSSSSGSRSNFLVGTLGPNANRGPSDFDIRHTLSAAVTYSISGKWTGNRLAHAVFGDWSVDSIVQARSAPPVNAFDGNLLFPGLIIGAVRPDVVPGKPLYLFGSTFPGGKALNPAAFTDPPLSPAGCNPAIDSPCNPTRQGNLGRNALRGFGATQWDFAVRREFPVRESLRLQFRAEFFNVLNHPNFASPINDLSSPFFGQSISMLGRGLSSNNPGDGSFASIFQIGGPRSIQFGLKVLF
jgi:hypothetical protein